jgi:hypothetical protein
MKKPFIVNAMIVGFIIVLDLISFKVFYNENIHIAAALALPFLAGVNFILGIIYNRKKGYDGEGFFIMSGVILLIGFGVCSGQL